MMRKLFGPPELLRLRGAPWNDGAPVPKDWRPAVTLSEVRRDYSAGTSRTPLGTAACSAAAFLSSFAW
jgi:hypothetical protein